MSRPYTCDMQPCSRTTASAFGLILLIAPLTVSCTTFPVVQLGEKVKTSASLPTGARYNSRALSWLCPKACPTNIPSDSKGYNLAGRIVDNKNGTFTYNLTVTSKSGSPTLVWIASAMDGCYTGRSSKIIQGYNASSYNSAKFNATYPFGCNEGIVNAQSAGTKKLTLLWTSSSCRCCNGAYCLIRIGATDNPCYFASLRYSPAAPASATCYYPPAPPPPSPRPPPRPRPPPSPSPPPPSPPSPPPSPPPPPPSPPPPPPSPPPDPCTPNPCANEAECVLGGLGRRLSAAVNNYFTCSCPPGFLGTLCDVPDPCHSQPCNGGDCATSIDGSAVTCSNCPDGFTGQYCEIDPCTPNPCANEAECVLGGFGRRLSLAVRNYFTCSCPPGFLGALCDVPDPCQSQPCNGGDCTTSIDGSAVTCSNCPDGFTGQYCEIDPCTPNPCANEAECVLGGLGRRLFAAVNNYFSCICPPGFLGALCQIPEVTPDGPCDTNPCPNGRICSDNPNALAGYSCRCPFGHTGLACDQLYTYVGCFADNAARQLPEALGQVSIVEDCAEQAHSQGFLIFGLQYGGHCFAGQDIDQAVSLGAATCDMACSGNYSQNCGGGYASEVYMFGGGGDFL